MPLRVSVHSVARHLGGGGSIAALPPSPFLFIPYLDGDETSLANVTYLARPSDSLREGGYPDGSSIFPSRPFPYNFP